MSRLLLLLIIECGIDSALAFLSILNFTFGEVEEQRAAQLSSMGVRDISGIQAAGFLEKLPERLSHRSAVTVINGEIGPTARR